MSSNPENKKRPLANQESTSAETSLDQFADAISRENFSEQDKKWVKDNITSIQKDVTSGEHSRVLYPAAGLDALRVAIAYQADEVIAIDLDPSLRQRLIELIEKSGFQYTITDTKPDECQIEIVENGKKHKIILIQKDAQLVLPNQEKTDVLHIYFPQGAIEDQLDLANYKLVKTGGIIVASERAISSTPLEPALESILGLREKEIVRRHPLTVETDHYPNQEELAEMEKTGFIYYKEKEVSDEVLTAGLQALKVTDSTFEEIKYFAYGHLQMIGVITVESSIEDLLADLSPLASISNKPLADLLLNYYEKMNSEIHTLQTEFRRVGIDEETVAQFGQQQTLDLKEKLKMAQKIIQQRLQNGSSFGLEWENISVDEIRQIYQNIAQLDLDVLFA